MSDAKEYLEAQGLSEALTGAVKQVITERPANATGRVAELLAAKSGAPPTGGATALDGATYYSFPPFPSPAVPEAFAAQIGCIDKLKSIYKFIDSPAGDNRTEDYLTNVNAMCELPCIKFADGSVLTETISICQFLEEAGYNSTGAKLFGADAKERGVISMWQRRIEQTICLPAMTATRAGIANALFKTRGTHSFLVPEMAEAQKKLCLSQMAWLEAQMTAAGGDFIACNKLSIVDIQLFVHIRFMTTFDLTGPEAKGAFPIPDMKDGLTWIGAWYKRMEALPLASGQGTMMG